MSQNMPAAGWYPDPEVPGQGRYWDGAAWTDHRTGPNVQPAYPRSQEQIGQDSIANEGAPTVAAPVAAHEAGVQPTPMPRPVKPRRPLWQTITAAFLLLLVGIGVGGAGGSGADADLRAANSKVKSLDAQLNAAKGENGSLASQNADLTTQANESKAAAENALGEARKQVAAENKKKAAELAARATALTKTKKSLDRREAKVSGMEHDWSANTIPGEGIYLVGSDIKPGTYKADASSGCYYARLSSINTSDIIDNNNVDGPVVVQVTPTDKALELSGCADFHKVG